MAINIEEDLQTILIEAGLSADQRSKVMKIAQEVEQEKKAEKEADKNNPKKKKKLNIVIRTDDPNICANIASGWVIESPEDVPVEQLADRMALGAKYQNENSKKKGKVFNWPDFFQYIKTKFLKTEDVLLRVKTKEAVQIVWLDKNEIPFK